MQIDKDTQIYASFSANPGSLGCKRFNNAFQKNGINAIYKSFFGIDFQVVFQACKTLDIAGFALSSPLKAQAYNYTIKDKTDRGLFIGCFNSNITIKLENFNVIKRIREFKTAYEGYNTDYFGIKEYYENLNDKKDTVYIIGMGSFAKTAQYVFSELGKSVFFINSRSALPELKDSIVFNASPLKDLGVKYSKNNLFIDCDTATESGRAMSFIAAKHQFHEVYGFSKDFIFEEVV